MLGPFDLILRVSLKYIYLPTAFIGLIKEDLDSRYYFQEGLQVLLNEYRGQYPDKLNLINKMESFYFELNDLKEIY
jgi:hypothetical protein